MQEEPPVDSKIVKVRRTEARLKKLPPPPAPPVLQLIRQAGFGGVLDLPFISLDLGLMAALLERWRPETHSFHLRSGECTVTPHTAPLEKALLRPYKTHG
ncbi:hypothetical protein RHGRI_014799 [Rhododendron griersonianum]|uniref:Aminotransferase-like plant mobile domain-containing protein n=1 Tax=Rhododendron griersonianum TaxID=479676 RepID=A0AAV6KAV7_9ERIC|nr:hypothetical protein RHGRI_014799 [Rhododendron griersonianum]